MDNTKKPLIKTDDVFFLVGLTITTLFIWLKYDCTQLVALVLGHKGVSVLDDKFKDNINGQGSNTQRPLRPLE